MNSHNVRIRRALPQDESFLRQLFHEVRTPEFEQAGLVGSQLTALLDQQYDAMRSHYAKFFSEAVYFIFEIDGEPIGQQAVLDGPEIHLIDISLRASHRGLGIGTERMKALLERAEREHKSVILSVEIFNPAKRLYERLGFSTCEESGIYQRMRWQETASTERASRA